MSNFHAIIPAGGSSQRMGFNKLLHEFSNVSVLVRTLKIILKTKNLSSITIACLESEKENYENLLNKSFEKKDLDIITCISGGSTRQESVKNAINSIKEKINQDNDYILIHDAARCLLSNLDLNNLCELALEKKAVSAGSKLVDTIKKVNEKGVVVSSIIRDNIWKIETPQIFNAKAIIEAHLSASNIEATDDASLLQESLAVYMYQTKCPNFKFTKEEDILVFEAVLDSYLNSL